MKTQIKPLPSHLYTFEGDLRDSRKNDRIIRNRYSWHYREIDTLAQAKATLRAGCFAWPGGYPLFLITHDGAALCFSCAIKEFRQIAYDHFHKCNTGWRVVGCDVNYEETDLTCDHCSKQIESAYGE